MTPESSCVEMMDGMLVLLFSWSAKKGQTQPYTCTEEIESICKYCPKETTTTTTTSTTTTTAPVTTTTTTTTTTTETTSTPTTTESTTSITTTEIKPHQQRRRNLQLQLQHQPQCLQQHQQLLRRTIGSNDQKISQVWIGNSESNGYLNWENGQPSKPNNGVDYCISMDLSAGPTRGKYKYLPCQNTVSHSICLMNS
uniref:C-type lectin domain-containing protein n=1 Tax=Caenorhabditis tropicalis TaxID=1561998 RepID=A0A1I7TX60_9PELO